MNRADTRRERTEHHVKDNVRVADDALNCKTACAIGVAGQMIYLYHGNFEPVKFIILDIPFFHNSIIPLLYARGLHTVYHLAQKYTLW
jgi:hypothetical protein